MTSAAFNDHLRDLIGDVDVILSDIWGVVHNGLAAWPDACEALTTFRKAGGGVILITNAPRPADSVQRQLRRFHVSDEVYDGIVSSGDLTRGYIESHQGQRVFHIGPERDISLFRGVDISLESIERADYIVCSGLFYDDHETAEDYREMLTRAAARKIMMVCANPDIVVERGDRLVYCAGALAEMYASFGGEVLYAGKPHRPIYERALALAAKARGKEVPPSRVLAIGDSVRTDLEGANAFGLRCLFVTSGIHAEELGARDKPDAGAITQLFAAASKQPMAVTSRLRW